MKAITLIDLCAREYQDISFTRVAKDPASSGSDNQANWLDWLNDAQRQVVLVRPDASSTTQNLTLVQGSRQTLPSGTVRLLKVNRNMGANGSTVGRAIRFSDHDVQDAVNLDWHTAAPASPVREVIYDDKKDSLSFWTVPPAVAGWKVEGVLSLVPADVTDVAAGNIALPDIYAGPLQAWMLHKAFALATQSTGQFQRAQFYLSSFFNQLGVKLKAENYFAAATVPTLPAPMPR